MVTAENVRTWIIEALLLDPALGQNYVDYHTENSDGCGLIIKLDGKEFDITIRAK